MLHSGGWWHAGASGRKSCDRNLPRLPPVPPLQGRFQSVTPYDPDLYDLTLEGAEGGVAVLHAKGPGVDALVRWLDRDLGGEFRSLKFSNQVLPSHARYHRLSDSSGRLLITFATRFELEVMCSNITLGVLCAVL